jgi:hypothetical protein
MGLALKGMLILAGYIFDIHFAGETMHRLFQAAAELVKVEKNEKGEFTRLSEAHIKSAAVPLRQMVADIAVMGVMHALGGMLRLAAKGLKKLKLECTHCWLDDLIAKEGEKQPENVPPEQPPVRAEDSPRGFAIEDAHVPQAGYRSLSGAGSVKAIDGIKGGDFDVVIENGQAVRVYTRPDGLSVKSTRVTNPIPLSVNITNYYLPPLRGRYSYKGGGIRINGLRNRRLDLLFEEGAHLNFTKETLRVLREAEAEAGSIDFNWYVYIQGRKVSGPEFLRDFGHLVTE